MRTSTIFFLIGLVAIATASKDAEAFA